MQSIFAMHIIQLYCRQLIDVMVSSKCLVDMLYVTSLNGKCMCAAF